MDGYKQIIARNIKVMRKECKYPQEYLSGEAKISLSNYREIEHGKANPTIETLDKIANKLSVYVGMFFEPSKGCK